MSSARQQADNASPSTFETDGRSFDHYARLVQKLLDVPVALVTLIEPHRQVFHGAAGLPEPYRTTRATPLTHSYCRHVVADGRPLVVPDARLDPRLHDNPAIAALGSVAYVGWPLVDEGGVAVGSLCAIDSDTREWTPEQVRTLQDLAHACSVELQQSHALSRDVEHVARAIFDSVDVAMAFYDADGRLLLANALAERAARSAGFRLDRAPYAGPHVRRADGVATVPAEDQAVPRALRGDPDTGEAQWIGPPGEQTALVWSSRTVRRRDGTPWGILVAGHDVTALARSLAVKEEFVATVSHELRTPLTSMVGYLEVLADELDPPAGFVADTLQTIERGAANLQRRIQELLDTADRRRTMDARRADVTALVVRVRSTLAEHARSSGVDLQIEPSEPAWAVVDAPRLEQAVENVVTNAVKYTRRGGRVVLDVTGLPDSVQVAVADDGIGMTGEEVDQAFDIFWRSPGVRDQAVQGIGVGLTLVRDILVQHHGTVDIDSEPGRGTTVTLTIPRQSPRS